MNFHIFTVNYLFLSPLNFIILLLVDCKLNVLTWRENYAGSSGLSSAKRSFGFTRIADGVRVTKSV